MTYDRIVKIDRPINKRRLWLVLISAMSLVGGFFIYAFIRVTPTYFETYIGLFFDTSFFVNHSIHIQNKTLRVLVNSFAADALWMLSFSTGLYLVFSSIINVRSRRYICFLVAVGVGSFLEYLQATEVIAGTFDSWDIVTFIASAYIGIGIASIIDQSNEVRDNLYANCDLYIKPSFYEGFGNAVLEAMSFGTPALVSGYASQPKVIKNSVYIVNEISSDLIKKALTNKSILSK